MRKKLIVPILILAIGAISFLVWAQNGASVPLPPENYAPNFWFDSDENYFPADPLDFYYENGDEIEGERAIAKYNSLSLGEKLSKIKAFYTIKDQDSEWVYEYWVFYVMNDFENGHYGDWESVFVFVDKNSGKIVRVNGSAHGSSNELTNLNNQNHIWNYVGNGSHANCPDEPADENCKFSLWNWREQWNKNGAKVYNNQYILKESSNDFIKNFKEQKSFDKAKSPTLGINLYKTFRLQDFNVPKPEKSTFVNLPIIGEFFGKTPYHAWAQPEYNDPEHIRPLTNRVGEATQKFVQNVANGIQNNVNLAISEIQFIFSQMNPFEAGVAQNIGQENQSGDTQNINEESESNFEMAEEENLIALQDQLDDAAERMDILNQKAIDSAALKNKQDLENKQDLGNKKENLDNKKDLEKVEEEIIEEIIEEEEQNEDEVKTAILKSEPKLCEKSVDNSPKYDKIVINELAWMGTDNSANNEWFELKNVSGEAVDLNHWLVVDKDKQIKIVFNEQTIIPAHGFFLFERTDDGAVSGINADFIYQGGLNNTDEALFIFDDSCRLADEVSAGSAWPSGDNVSKRTMERKADLGWQTSANINGTPKQENSVGFIVSEAPTAGGVGSDAEQTVISPQILITEIQIGDATSSADDFIELYNPNAETVDISNWQLKKKNSSGNEYSIRVLPDNSVIASQSYFIWMNTDYAGQSSIVADATSSQTLASDNSLALLDSNRNIIDQVAWGTSTDPYVETVAFAENPADGQTLGRKWSTTTQNYTGTASSAYLDADDNQNDFEIQSPTPKLQNQTWQEPEPEEPNFNVVINEIAWMGTNSLNSSDEWIELYNNTASEVDLTGWKILKNGESFINLATSTIAANGFYLLERTDSNTTSVVENQVYTGSLSNSGEKLELRNAGSILIDLVDATAGWPAGTTSPAYISMERINSSASGTDSANWADNNLISRNGTAANGANINGTPASQNSVSKTETNVASLPFDEFDEIALTALGNPYTIQNTLEVPQNKKLIIEPAVTLKFYIPDLYGPNDGAVLQVNGILEAVGAEGQEILFTSTGAIWPGIVFNAAVAETATSSVMNYVKIEKARSWEANIYSAVKITNKAVSIQNSTFDAYSNMRGLYLINSSSTVTNNNFNNFTGSINSSTGEQESAVFIDTGAPTIKNNTFTNNYNGIVVSTKETCLQNPSFKISGNNFSQTVMPVYITDTGFPCFEQNQITNSTADSSGVVFNGVVYKGVGMDQDNLWQSDSPIILETGFSLQNATLTVASGATIKFKYSSNISPNTFLKIENGGRLITQGTADSLVTFTSNKETPVAGSWQAVWFANGSFGELNFTRMQYGGFGSGSFRNECLLIESIDVILNNTTKEFCEPY